MTSITPTISNLRMLSSIRGQQWMIRPDKVEEFALAAMELPQKRAECDDDEVDDYFPMRCEPWIDAIGIGHVEVKGALLNECPKIYEKLGLATTYATIIDDCEDLVEEGAKGILLHINSPGGTVSGNVECAQFIRSLPVPTASHCVGLACSAAYKLAASTSFILAAPSAEVGNIGTILTWPDCTEFWRQMGIEFKALTNQGADLKSTFHLEPNATQLAFLQEGIDECGAEFIAWVKQGRPGIQDEVFRAGWYSGTRAEALGLIDGMGTPDEAAMELSGMLAV